MNSELKNLLKAVIPKRLKSFFLGSKKVNDKRHYEGSAVTCTICGSKFSTFAPFGSPRRQNAKCLKCSSLERHRLIWKYMHDNTDFFKQEKLSLLHFAPEKFFYEAFSNMPSVEYVPCDLFPELFMFAGSNKVRRVDITAIPFPENTFDVVLCNHVLEHIPDDRQAMSELYRVMKPGAWAILQVPIDYRREKSYEDFSITTEEGRKAAFGQKDHVRWYGKDYKDRLSSVGFGVKEDRYVLNFSDAERFQFGFQASELIYFCRK